MSDQLVQQLQEMEYLAKMEKYGLPRHMRGGLVSYILTGRPVGSFLTSVLRNNLMDAVGNADGENIRKLPEYVQFLYNEAPMESWGSPENVQKWIECRGLWGVKEDSENLNDVPPENDGYW